MITRGSVKIKMAKRWFTYLYPLLLTVGALAVLPKTLKRWRKIPERLAEGTGPSIWIHAVSVGEARAVAPLAKLLHERVPGLRLVVSSITNTGHEEAKRAMPFAKAHVFLPMDYAWIVRRWLRWFSPSLVLVSETDFWYQFLRIAKEQGAKLAVVNGKISARSTQRHQQFPLVSAELLGLFDLICVQSSDYKVRFRAVSLPEERLAVTGNMKFDDQPIKMDADSLRDWRARLGLHEGQQVVVAGSTHDPEEKLILEAMQEVWAQRPQVKLVVVPRHPERFGEVAKLLTKEGILFDRWSQNTAARTNVMLMDAMGLLRSCYQMAEVAIVAGSFTQKIGGHNLLEPAAYGVPLLFGPYTHSQPELARVVLAAGAGRQVRTEELGGALLRLLASGEERATMRKAALELTKSYCGATQRTYEELQRRFNLAPLVANFIVQ